MTTAMQPIYPLHLRVRARVWNILAGFFLHQGWIRPARFCMKQTLKHWERLAEIQRGAV